MGFRCGLTKDQVLALSLEEFQACLNGYSERLKDQQKLAIQQGYWTAYYLGAKHPKSVDALIEAIDEGPQKHLDEVDVATFLERERMRKEAMSNGRSS